MHIKGITKFLQVKQVSINMYMYFLCSLSIFLLKKWKCNILVHFVPHIITGTCSSAKKPCKRRLFTEGKGMLITLNAANEHKRTCFCLSQYMCYTVIIELFCE